MHLLKNVLITLLTLLFVAPLTAQQATTDSTTIEGFIEGLQAGKTRMVGTYGDQNYLADSAMIDASGHFMIRRRRTLPAGYYTFLLPGGKNFAILIDKNEQHLVLKAKAADIPGTLQTEGSLNTQLFYENMRFQSLTDGELMSLGETMKKNAMSTPEYQTARKRQEEILESRKAQLAETIKKYPDAFYVKFKVAGQNPDYLEFKKPNGDIDTIRQIVSYRNRFWNGVDFTDTRLLYTPVIVNKLKRYIKDFTPQNPDTLIVSADALIKKSIPYPDYFKFITNWIALQYENGKTTVMDGEAVYVHIIKTYFTPELATWSTKEELDALQKHVWEMEASLMGRKGPNVTAADVNGQMHSIYDIPEPLVVVFMFSPDCEHCQKEAPEVERLYKKWKPRGVEFYGIAVNTKDQEWRDFVKKMGFTFPNVFDPTNRAIYAKYFVDITPELYVLNKDRIIVAKNLKSEQLETVFERELKKLKK